MNYPMMTTKSNHYLTALTLLLLISGALHAQTIVLKGRITDAGDKSTLVGANVVEVDKNGRYIKGAIADVNGNYVLEVSSSQAIVQVSFIGYIKQTFEVGKITRLDVALEPESIQMAGVVITGERMGNDGVVPIRDRITAVSRIELSDLKGSSSTTVEEMIQGRLGNVDITQLSGDPGAGLNIRIRGTASLNARNQPLIVVNGIPYETQIDESFDFAQADVDKFGNLIDVAPEDIESIEVLKDAAATAIWGSKASNGVLMINTKRGIKSPPVFQYNFKVTRAHEPPHIPMLDGPGYARLITEAHYNVTYNTFSNDEIAYRPNDEEWDQYYNFAQNTDWIEEITRVAYTLQNNFSVRGGGAKSKYNLSMGYMDEEGTTVGTGLKKFNMLTALDYDLSSKLQFRTDILFTRYDQDETYAHKFSDGFEYSKDNFRTKVYAKMPNMSVYERDTNNVVYDDFFIPSNGTIQGNAKDYFNPVAFATLPTNKTYKNNTRASFNLRYKPISVLELTGQVTLDVFDSKNHKFLPYKAIGYDYSNVITNNAYDNFIKKSTINTTARALYHPDLGDNHNITVRGQFDSQESVQNTLEIETRNTASGYSDNIDANQRIDKMNSGSSTFRLIGFFMDAYYDYKDKYFFMIGAKSEGSSRFSPESRWGVFPTASVGWRISGENFLKDKKFINDLMLRASWGQSGNTPEDNYLYFRKYGAGTDVAYVDMPGIQPTNIELTGLKWETIEQTNFGLTYSGFQGRIYVVFDVYNKKTKNLYIKDAKIPQSTGYATINSNVGELLNRGWEFMIDSKILEGDQWSFDINLNASQNKNIILSLPENYQYTYGNMLDNGNYKISNVPGQPIGGFFGYRYLGVYPTDEDAIVRDEFGQIVYDPVTSVPLITTMGGARPDKFEGGDAWYDDINHDGIIDENDLVYLGDLNPKLMGGISPRFHYRNWILNLFFYYKVGQKIINQTRMDLEKMTTHDNQSKATNWRWRRSGDITDIPRAYYPGETNPTFNYLGSSRFVENGDFIRFKSVSIKYNLGQKLCSKLRLDNVSLYLTGYNTYTWTNYSGQDPDVSQPTKPDELPKDWSRTPPSIRYMFGADITF